MALGEFDFSKLDLDQSPDGELRFKSREELRGLRHSTANQRQSWLEAAMERGDLATIGFLAGLAVPEASASKPPAARLELDELRPLDGKPELVVDSSPGLAAARLIVNAQDAADTVKTADETEPATPREGEE
jgi:hypothetical protein